jgi:hypothetical protein
MSSIIIRDLSHSKELDRHTMSAVRGGYMDNIRIGSPDITVGVAVIQNLNQKQVTNVNVGNVGPKWLGGFGYSPMQTGSLEAAPTVTV